MSAPGNTKYMVVSKGSTFTHEGLGEFLNTFYSTSGNEAFFKFRGIPKYGFYILHEVIVAIKRRDPLHGQHFEFYSQEGEGQIREYSIPAGKKSAPAKKAEKDLEEILKRKGKI